MTDQVSKLGPLEAEIFEIFRKAWSDANLESDHPPSGLEFVTAVLNLFGRCEEAIRLVAARVDERSQ